jgi:fucose permease
MSLIAKPHRGLYTGLFGVFAIFGTSMTIIGAALPKILEDFGWTYASAGAVIASSAAAYAAFSFLSGRVLERIGPKATILIGLVLCVIGLAFFAATPSFLLNFLLNALVGAGQGLIEPTINWSTLRMDEKSSGRPMSLMHGAYAIGAVAGPIVLGAIMASGLDWTLLFRAISILFAALGIALAPMPFDRLGDVERSGGESKKATERARSPAYWLGFACLLLYVGAELGISNWIAEYFVRIFSADPATASLTVSLFWVGLLAGRFGVPALYRGNRQETVLVSSSILLVVSTILLCAIGFLSRAVGPAAGAPSLWAPAALTFLAGLGCSIIYPTVVSLVGIACKESQAKAVSFAIAGGGVGLFAFPFAMSWVSQAYGIKIGFASYAVIAALTAASCAALAKTFASARRKG